MTNILHVLMLNWNIIDKRILIKLRNQSLMIYNVKHEARPWVKQLINHGMCLEVESMNTNYTYLDLGLTYDLNVLLDSDKRQLLKNLFA